MRSRCFAILCFIASISIASGLWYDEEDWGLEYPELTTFVCPSNGPITSVYSEYNHNTSQREWKFSCDWNELTDLDITTSWSPYKNNFQQDFSFSCAQFDESHFIFGFNVLYDPKLADGRWRFGCGRFPPEYQLVNCTEIPSSDSIGKLQEVFEYTATDNTTFVTGVISEYDNGLKDRMWGLAYCKLGIVQCDKPPQPEGVEVTYDSLEYGSLIKYNCKKNYTYFPEGSGSCDKYGLWTTSPPDCQPCSTIPYCQSVLCTSSDLTVTVCLECQNFTDDGLELERTSNFRCEAEPMITNSLPKTILFYSDDILTLNCNAIGYPKPKVVWLHNSTVVSPGNGVLVLSNGSLVILSPIPSDAGLYVCMAINDRQNLSISVTLKWREFEPPIIVDWTNTVYFLLKHSAKLDCIATGHPQPNIIWYKDGNLIEHKKRIKIFVDNGTLFITKVKEKDIGKYRCEAKNKIGWIAREALVHVYEKVDTQIPEDPDQSFAPIIKSWNLLVQGFPNDQVVLNCNSSGNPKPKIKWSRVTSYGYKVIKENNRTFLYDNGSLIIKDVDLKDRGQYVCQASNTEGVVEKHLLLMVKPRTSTPTSVVTTTAPSVATTTTTTTGEITTTTSPPISHISSETSTAPTNSTQPLIDTHPPTDSHALTLNVYWSCVCTLSVCTILSLL